MIKQLAPYALMGASLVGLVAGVHIYDDQHSDAPIVPATSGCTVGTMVDGQCIPDSAWDAPTYSLPPCITDGDEANCYWDADTMGNGQGEDYILLNGIQYHAG